jgi:hypothetical protein
MSPGRSSHRSAASSRQAAPLEIHARIITPSRADWRYFTGSCWCLWESLRHRPFDIEAESGRSRLLGGGSGASPGRFLSISAVVPVKWSPQAGQGNPGDFFAECGHIQQGLENLWRFCGVPKPTICKTVQRSPLDALSQGVTIPAVATIRNPQQTRRQRIPPSPFPIHVVLRKI